MTKIQKVRFGKMHIQAPNLTLFTHEFSPQYIKPKDNDPNINIHFFIGNAIFSMRGWEDINISGNEDLEEIIIQSNNEVILRMIFKNRMFEVESFFEIDKS